jgi:hypothetical protein
MKHVEKILVTSRDLPVTIMTSPQGHVIFFVCLSDFPICSMDFLVLIIIKQKAKYIEQVIQYNPYACTTLMPLVTDVDKHCRREDKNQHGGTAIEEEDQM